MFCSSIFKRISKLFFSGGRGGEPPDPSPSYIRPCICSAQNKLYHATAVCNLRCIEVISVIK